MSYRPEAFASHQRTGPVLGIPVRTLQRSPFRALPQTRRQVAPWAAASFLDAEETYRKIMGYRDLSIFKAPLAKLTSPVARKEVAL